MFQVQSNFQQGQQNNYNNAPVAEQKEKSNWAINKIYGSNGVIDIGVYKSVKSGAVFMTVLMKVEVGKDPNTGAPVYQQKKSNELPNMLLSGEQMGALLKFCQGKSVYEMNNIKISTPNYGSFVINFNKEDGSVTISLVGTKNGDANVTLKAVSVSDTDRPINANWEMFLKYVEIAYKKNLTRKLDKEEFAMALGSDENSEEAPF